MKQASTVVLAVAAMLGAGASSALAQAGPGAAGDWVALSGTVVAVDRDGEEFRVGHGDLEIEVEMDDWSVHGTQAVAVGDVVTVIGRSDDDLFEDRSLEATSVYVARLQDYAYRDPRHPDPYAAGEGGPVADPGAGGDWLRVTGTLAAVGEGELSLTTGGTTVRVDVRGSAGQPVGAGDRVVVTGMLDGAGLFRHHGIVARSVEPLPAGQP
jgi:uncharacterized protein YdeI (BOF family)